MLVSVKHFDQTRGGQEPVEREEDEKLGSSIRIESLARREAQGCVSAPRAPACSSVK